MIPCKNKNKKNPESQLHLKNWLYQYCFVDLYDSIVRFLKQNPQSKPLASADMNNARLRLMSIPLSNMYPDTGAPGGAILKPEDKYNKTTLVTIQ